ncbi:MAG: FtsB family cell division protein [Actinomycetota bacterium]
MRALALRRIRLPKLGIWPQIVVLVLVLGLVGAMAIEPTRQLFDQRDRIASATTDLQRLERSNVRLEDQIRRLNDPDFIEQQARQVGLVRPGEIPFVVMPPSRDPDQVRARKKQAAPAPEPEPGWFEGFVNFLGL